MLFFIKPGVDIWNNSVCFLHADQAHAYFPFPHTLCWLVCCVSDIGWDMSTLYNQYSAGLKNTYKHAAIWYLECIETLKNSKKYGKECCV